MEKSISPILLVISVCIICCKPENRIFEDHHKEFPDHRWAKSKYVEFKFEVSDTASVYDVYNAFRHVYGFQFPNLNIEITSKSPSGIETTKNYDIQVMGKNNEYLGNCSVDICDLDSKIEEGIRFKEIGTYTYSIKHLMPVEQLPNVMECGLIVEKQIPTE